MSAAQLDAAGRTPLWMAALIALVGFAPAAAQACGACVEDSVAATYDHQVVQRAAAAGDVVVFCGVAGTADPQRLAQALRQVRGVKAQSLRTSTQPAALSFVVDPGAQSPEAAVAAAQRGLPAGTRLKIVRLLQPPARKGS